MTANAYHQYYEIPRPKYSRFYIDNSTVIDRLKTIEWQSKLPSKTTLPEFESLWELHTLHRKHTPSIEVIHVKGHQSGPNLSWQAQLNNKCDELASEARKLPPLKQYYLQTSNVKITLNNQYIASAIPMSFRQAYSS